MRQPTKQAYDLIKQFENISLTSYLCSAGKPTIGWGHTGKEVKLGQSITRQLADDLFITDVESAVEDIHNYVDDVERIPEISYDALVSFVFNNGFWAFKSKKTGKPTNFLKTLNSDHYIMTGKNMLQWIYADGKISNGLINRRNIESELWFQGFE